MQDSSRHFYQTQLAHYGWRVNKARFSDCTILTSDMLLEDTSLPLLFVSHSLPHKSFLSNSLSLSSYTHLYNYTVQHIWPELANCGISLSRSLAFRSLKQSVTLTHFSLYPRILVDPKV